MKNLTILSTETIIEALKKLDQTAEKVLFVVDENNKLLGSLTDGDIRRYILKHGKIEGKILDIYHKKPIVLNEHSLEKARQYMLKYKVEVIPIVDENYLFVDAISWDKVFREKEEFKRKENTVTLPVVIMAGGLGTRLAPFTGIFPKPLIPVGNKTMIEHVIDNFKNYGVKKFIITVNHKGKLIEAYFNSIERDYDIEFIWEKEFLGTAGSLKLLSNLNYDDFIVSNCDIIVKTDFSNLVEFHKQNNSLFISVTSIQHYKIPYGIVTTKSGGAIESIEEKPEYSFQINTGVYVLNTSVLEFIPYNQFFDMPNLINVLLTQNKKVVAYPVNEGDYIDMGQWEEYKKAVEKINIL